jgi:regulator of sigma E protease
VTVHEFGHFWVARRCGVKVLRFSIGFGKAIKTWVGKDGTEYVIAPIPLGGYVKMLGQEDTSVADNGAISESERKQSFSCKPVWQRMAIVAAGPAANFLLAIAVFWIINVSYGLTGTAPVLANVAENSPAHRAGLRAEEAAKIGMLQSAEHAAKEESASGCERGPAELRRRSTGLFPPLFRVL